MVQCFKDGVFKLELEIFKNVFNNYYAKDTSRKIRAVVKMCGEAGEHIASYPPFGYMKDPEDKKKWIVDEEAAHIVRRIFDLFLQASAGMYSADADLCAVVPR